MQIKVARFIDIDETSWVLRKLAKQYWINGNGIGG